VRDGKNGQLRPRRKTENVYRASGILQKPQGEGGGGGKKRLPGLAEKLKNGSRVDENRGMGNEGGTAAESSEKRVCGGCKDREGVKPDDIENLGKKELGKKD